MKIIQIGHKKRMGKDTLATLIKYHAVTMGKRVEILSFANALKDIMADALGITITELNDLKNNDEFYRSLLQRFGSGKIKHYFGLTVWVQIVEKQIQDLKAQGVDAVILADFRFPYERLEGSVTYNVVRGATGISGLSATEHISETALNGYRYDHVIENNGTIKDLSNKAKAIAESI